MALSLRHPVKDRLDNALEPSRLYTLDDLVLELHSEEPIGENLDCLLHELSWVRAKNCIAKPALCISVGSNNHGLTIPPNCREVLRVGDFVGVELGDEFYLTDGSSLFHLIPAKGEGFARLAPPFASKSPLEQANFWCFGLFKLLRSLGIYSLHAAGLATVKGRGLLLVGPSGSGKSTLAIGLIRSGWNYLSDDAVFLSQRLELVQALACRKSFYIDAGRSSDYPDLWLHGTADSNRRQRRKIGINKVYPQQHVSCCLPSVVIFPRIIEREQSTLKPMDRLRALGVLLSQSAPQLFDRSTMAGHLELLKRLLEQTQIYELSAGTDLYHAPAKLNHLLCEAQKERNWQGLSLS